MDPVTHTLSGVALGSTGAQKQTRFARAAFILAAVAPDVDFLISFWDMNFSLEFRRGITHGILGLIFLPWMVAGIFALINHLKLQKKKPKFNFKKILLYSYLGVFLHSCLDYLNTYGIRWLMPFSDTWFYLDTLFIVDLYLFLILVIGLIWTRIKKSTKPIITAMILSVFYIASNFGISQYAKHTALASLDTAPEEIMTSPVPLNPFKRSILIAYQDQYILKEFNLFSISQLDQNKKNIPKNINSILLSQLKNNHNAQVFLNWARFPYAIQNPETNKVTLYDARYVSSPDQNYGFGFLEINLNQ